jgi:hypothetical protein
MRKCSECQHPLLEKARFCHECGSKVAKQEMICTQCGDENPIDAKFCRACGFNFQEKEGINELFEDLPTQDLEKELFEAFFEHLEFKIAEEQSASLQEEYINVYEKSDFKFSFEIKVKQLAEDVKKARESPDYQAKKTKQKLAKTFEDISDFFIIHHCAHLNPIYLSEKILAYRDANKENTDLLQMIEDFLSFDQEESMTYYTNFLEMPMDRLRKAGKSFLFPDKDEKILLICDQSVLGSLKEGFAFTEKALYWRMHFEPARKVLYENISEVKREKDWITINGHFFNTNDSLNVRILKLLNKLRFF